MKNKKLVKRPISISRQLNLLVSFVAFFMVFITITSILYASYKIQIRERTHSLEALSVTLSKLIARPLTLGDFVLVEHYLNEENLPSFISLFQVKDKDGKVLAGQANKISDSMCRNIIKIDVPIFDEKFGKKNEVLSVVSTTCDIRQNIFKFAAISIVFIFLIVFLILVTAKAAVFLALKPLFFAVKKSSASDELEKDFIQHSPDEIRPLLLKLQKIYNEKLKMESSAKVGDIALQVAHDLRSPLSAIRIFIDSEEDFSGQKKIGIKRALERIKDIANSLVDVKKGVSENNLKSLLDADIDTYEVLPILQQIVDEKKLQYKNKILVDSSSLLLKENICVKFSKLEFSRIISNIIDNSFDACLTEVCEVKLTSKITDNKLSIFIEDKGKGIPADILPKLTQKGATFNKRGGSGLGLYHARSCIERWSGSLTITSIENIGTTIEILLPSLERGLPGILIKYDCILIDDEDIVRAAWEVSAEENSKKIKTFSRVPLEDELALVDRRSKVFIDSNLGDGVRGEQSARFLFDLGFKDIYLSTGNEFLNLEGFYWIKRVVNDKIPPWISL